MLVKDCNPDDGKTCISLINFLKSGRWEMTGQEVDEMIKVKIWVQSLARQVASNISGPKPSSPSDTQMTIKAMGPIGGTSSAPIKTKRKK